MTTEVKEPTGFYYEIEEGTSGLYRLRVFTPDKEVLNENGTLSGSPPEYVTTGVTVTKFGARWLARRVVRRYRKRRVPTRQIVDTGVIR